MSSVLGGGDGVGECSRGLVCGCYGRRVALLLFQLPRSESRARRLAAAGLFGWQCSSANTQRTEAVRGQKQLGLAASGP